MTRAPPVQPSRSCRVAALGPARCAAVCGAILALGGPARSAPVLPTVDTTALCEMRLRRDTTLLVGDCVSAERRALDDLRPAYAAVPARVRSRCERLSRRETGGIGSYAFIQGCVDLK